MLKRSVVAAVMAAGFVLLHPGAPAYALQECLTDCAVLEVGDVDIPSNGSGQVTIRFTQGPDDQQAGQGNDDIAAIAFSIGIPGSGSGNPLELPCTDGGVFASGAVNIASAISNDFQVVIENETCNARERCLCPTGDQTRDDFINVVVYGPRDIPDGGPVEIPRLPDSGTLMTIRLEAGDGVQQGQEYDLHIFCEQDNGDPARPEFTADLSIGDQSAIDQTANRDQDRSRITCDSGTATIIEGGTCVGDCNGDGQVAINELIQGVNISLGTLDVSVCEAMDENRDGQVSINELIRAVNNALGGCPG